MPIKEVSKGGIGNEKDKYIRIVDVDHSLFTL
jgi:hypothetical protein